jgi:aminomethyltransferase
LILIRGWDKMAAHMSHTPSPDTTAAPPKKLLQKTPLYDRHVALGARIIDFGGWALPVQYSSIIEEHKAVRSAVGIFDVSHMGEVEFVGRGALAAVERLVSNDVRKLVDGQARYTVVCYPDGGIVDDCIVYREHSERILIVVNAANVDKDVAWFRQQTAGAADCTMRDRSADYALIAVQGPRAVALVDRLASGPGLAAVKSFHFQSATLAGVAVWAARTGYTGEDGFELFCAPGDAGRLWDALLLAGQDFGIKPCGLGARDTLRLESCLSLYGNDIDQTTNPYDAGLGWVVKLDHDFIGRAALESYKSAGSQRKLTAFVMEGRGTARHGYPIYATADAATPLGVVTSGSLGPWVQKNLGLGYLPNKWSEPGQTLFIDCRGKRIAAQVVKAPFYRRPTAS